MRSQPVITAGAIAGLLLAGWEVLVKQGLFDVLRPEALDALNLFVSLLIPILAAIVASRFVTPISDPNLPLGTAVNVNSDAPTGVVVRD